MPLYAILVREYFGARIMGTVFGAVGFVSTLGMAIGPVAGGWLYDAFGSYFWLFMGSFGIGLGAVAIAFTFRPPRVLRWRNRDRAWPTEPQRGGPYEDSETAGRNIQGPVRPEGDRRAPVVAAGGAASGRSRHLFVAHDGRGSGSASGRARRACTGAPCWSPPTTGAHLGRAQEANVKFPADTGSR